MLIPVLGFVRGDTLGLLVLVHDTDTVADLARASISAAAIRVKPTHGAKVYRRGVELPPRETVGRLGIEALERIDIVPEPAGVGEVL